MRLASHFGRTNQIRRDRPLTREELMQVVPSVFSENCHGSGAKNTLIYPPLPCSKTFSAKALNPSSHASHAFETRAAGNTPNTCCACVVPAR